jgi:hypothetical protein
MDILQNIEFAIVNVQKRQPALVDFDVDAALAALTAYYQAQTAGREVRPVRLNERSQQVYDEMKIMCEWRMGNELPVAPHSRKRVPQPPPVPTDIIIACLKRIRKSVQRWNREGGRQGYLTFVERFIQ